MFEERSYLSGVLLDLGLEFARISTNDLGDLFSINKDEESRHGTDFTGLSNIGNFIDIDLQPVRLLREIECTFKTLQECRTLTNLALVYLAENSSNFGEIILQGPHQTAWKSTMVTPEDVAVWNSEVLVIAWTIFFFYI